MNDFVSPTGINWNGGGTVGTVQYGKGDAGMIAIFYMKPMHQTHQSLEEGRPIYKDTVYVKIHPPGERLNIVDRPATAQDKQRFPMQWHQFQQNQQQIPDGTPVDMLYPDQPSIAAMLKASGVHTIEQLAELSANAIEEIGMGAQRYVNDAAKYLSIAEKGVKGTQLRKELEERDGKIRTLEQKVELLIAENKRLASTAQSGPSMEQLQQLLSGLQGRPQFPAGAPKQMNPAFDVATAQINANDPRKEMVKNRRKRQRIDE